MLISMPTDTSTIFGVFQAIAGFLLNWDDFLPLVKVIQFKKFASDYFVAKRNVFCAAVQNEIARYPAVER
jgi:hypothetical protein